MDGQGEANGGVRRIWIALGLAALACAAGIGFLWPEQMASAAATAVDRPTPSGLPVPRYVSLKFGEVNARAGPGDDHRLLWVYRVRGLPVQVVAETSEWRRVCDPEHGLAWVHKRTTDGRRMVMRLQPQPLALRRAPKPEAEVEAYLRPRALAALIHCKKGWCRIRADGVAGWAPAAALWGTDDKPQCR
ncbi:SH3 domain-containing protein [Phenylobacterium sp.]|uniref:SH3 domain-containing protein n=1 Tax=Phenylobacterium sp. TaxID=1871053 RepID=UPI0035AFB66D